MSFYDTQMYCGIVDMKVVVVGICNKINFTKVWIAPTNLYPIEIISDCDIVFISQAAKFHHGGYFAMLYIRPAKPTLWLKFINRL